MDLDHRLAFSGNSNGSVWILLCEAKQNANCPATICLLQCLNTAYRHLQRHRAVSLRQHGFLVMTASRPIINAIVATLRLCSGVIRSTTITVVRKVQTRLDDVIGSYDSMLRGLLMMQDYIFWRLMRSGLLAEGSSYSGDAAGGKLSDVSREIQVIGARLESVYPNLFQNVSRQVNIAIKVYSTQRGNKTDFLAHYRTDSQVYRSCNRPKYF